MTRDSNAPPEPAPSAPTATLPQAEIVPFRQRLQSSAPQKSAPPDDRGPPDDPGPAAA